MEKKKVIVIGTGLGSLSAAALLAKDGVPVTLIERNWIPGGCTSTYPRLGRLFEAGATTLVGLEPNMPLGYLLHQINLSIPAETLNLPMQVSLPNGKLVNRYPSLEKWIEEAENTFGKEGQRPFWELCKRISDEVWKVSVTQFHFPPQSFGDLLDMAKNVRIKSISILPFAFSTIDDLLKKFNLQHKELFRKFVNEQLLITAQNTAEEVNALFGATALCYTLYGNYYLNGGMQTLVNELVKKVEAAGGELLLRTEVKSIRKTSNGYFIGTNKGDFEAEQLISGIPVNNLAELVEDSTLKSRLTRMILPSEKLVSAFSMGISYEATVIPEAIHRQIILKEPLPQIGSKSIFFSTHPQSDQRGKPGELVANISTHIEDPGNTLVTNKAEIEERILQVLEEEGLLCREQITYKHSSTPGAWEKWTGRKFGFVGGYPQYKSIKPWQLNAGRIEKHFTACGDSFYPGQGIPGVVLGGIIAYEKLGG